MSCSIAIMQPYLFPYLGYFQLIHAADVFVFYDDVNFVKKGWINRNKLMVNGSEYLFTLPMIGASQNKKICDIPVLKSDKWEAQFFRTLQQNYGRAPNFENVYELVRNIFKSHYSSVADLAIESVKQICGFLNLSTQFEVSSVQYGETAQLKLADRLIAITKQRNCNQYINPSGGKELYKKVYFAERGIKLSFIENRLTPYSHFGNRKVAGLSIIDLLMFNDLDQVHKLLTDYNID